MIDQKSMSHYIIGVGYEYWETRDLTHFSHKRPQEIR